MSDSFICGCISTWIPASLQSSSKVSILLWDKRRYLCKEYKRVRFFFNSYIYTRLDGTSLSREGLSQNASHCGEGATVGKGCCLHTPLFAWLPRASGWPLGDAGQQGPWLCSCERASGEGCPLGKPSKFSARPSPSRVWPNGRWWKWGEWGADWKVCLGSQLICPCRERLIRSHFMAKKGSELRYPYP